VVDDSGSFTFTATLVPSGGTATSFAAWGTFIDQYAICSSPFVPGTLTGPVFTNGAWTFSDSGPYIFADSGSVSQMPASIFPTARVIKKPRIPIPTRRRKTPAPSRRHFSPASWRTEGQRVGACRSCPFASTGAELQRCDCGCNG
jgi:hypothetical protein